MFLMLSSSQLSLQGSSALSACLPVLVLDLPPKVCSRSPRCALGQVPEASWGWLSAGSRGQHDLGALCLLDLGWNGVQGHL